MWTDIDISKEEITKQINNIEHLIEIIREEMYQNNCDEDDKKWMENLIKQRADLKAKKDKLLSQN